MSGSASAKVKRARPRVGYTDRVAVVHKTDGESKVRQCFKEEVEVTNILKRYRQTGLLPVNATKPVFADVADFTDYKTALDRVAELKRAARKLPREAREMLAENPQEFAKMISQDTTRENLERIGVLKPEKAEGGPEEGSPPPEEPAEPAGDS